MDDRKLARIIYQVNLVLKTAVLAIGILLVVMIYFASEVFMDKQPDVEAYTIEEIPEVVDGIHSETGLIDGAGLQLVIQNCTACHSSKLIIQNKMNHAGWLSTIKWMQETQNLWDLGANEELILEYLATNYAPQKKGRRANLDNIEWYELD